jgi:hypothetical protein
VDEQQSRLDVPRDLGAVDRHGDLHGSALQQRGCTIGGAAQHPTGELVREMPLVVDGTPLVLDR